MVRYRNVFTTDKQLLFFAMKNTTEKKELDFITHTLI